MPGTHAANEPRAKALRFCESGARSARTRFACYASTRSLSDRSPFFASFLTFSHSSLMRCWVATVMSSKAASSSVRLEECVSSGIFLSRAAILRSGVSFGFSRKRITWRSRSISLRISDAYGLSSRSDMHQVWVNPQNFETSWRNCSIQRIR